MVNSIYLTSYKSSFNWCYHLFNIKKFVSVLLKKKGEAVICFVKDIMLIMTDLSNKMILKNQGGEYFLYSLYIFYI